MKVVWSLFFMVVCLFGAGDHFLLEGRKIFVPGSMGMVGSAIIRECEERQLTVLKTTRQELDLAHAGDVDAYFATHRPDVVFLAAAKVGGILANHNYPADFIMQNIQIELNIIQSCVKYKVQKLIFLGSSCIYPKFAEQPIQESALLTGALEPTNQWYAVAKIAGLKMAQACRLQYGCDFISVMPTNLYGPGDTYHAENSHVIPSLILKFHKAKMEKNPAVTLWGTGSPRREFLFVKDCAKACLLACEKYSDIEPLNIGCGEDITICDLALIVKDVIGYDGDILWDTSKPDGTPRKLLNVDKLKGLGFCPAVSLYDGIKIAYADYLSKV